MQIYNKNRKCCILSKFYIKPQLVESAMIVCVVVSYRNSTSNHNNDSVSMTGVSVVSYRNSTSNHNTKPFFDNFCELYLIEILHQTTTFTARRRASMCCILSKFYIKPQQSPRGNRDKLRCILSKFYIKPQPPWPPPLSWYCCILSKFYIKPQPSRCY